jgi:Zn-dependent peptidase ImmA (M78 family)
MIKPNVEFSVLDILGESLERLWNPGMEAIKLQLDHRIQTVEDIPVAAQKVGCHISYVSLPTKVSGFAHVIEGTPHIVVNRAKPLSHTRFTIAHELGHHQLHLTRSRNNDQAQPPNNATEFEANMFASVLVSTTTSDEQQEQMLAHNPEIPSTLAVCMFATVLAILMALVIWFCANVFRTPDSAMIQTT